MLMRKSEEGGRKGFSGFEISKLGGDETPQDPNRGKAIPVLRLLSVFVGLEIRVFWYPIALPITRTQVYLLGEKDKLENFVIHLRTLATVRMGY
jgi:hypothetical protein